MIPPRGATPYPASSSESTIPGPSDLSTAFEYTEAFSRNIGLVSQAEQTRLRQAAVAIAGVGGVGGLHVLALARLGIGRFSLADPDRFELVNLNRQAGANMATLGRPKVHAMAERVAGINPTAEVRVLAAEVDDGTIDAFLRGVDAVVDGIDFFNMPARRLLFRKARDRGIPALTAAPIGFGATLHVFSPTGMSFDEYFDLRDDMALPEQLLHFGLGLAPKLAHLRYFPPDTVDLTGRRAPSLGPACFLCAALVSTEIANLLLGRRPVRCAPYFFQFDPLVQRYATGRLWLGNRNPIQRAKKWWILHKNPQLRRSMGEARS